MHEHHESAEADGPERTPDGKAPESTPSGTLPPRRRRAASRPAGPPAVEGRVTSAEAAVVTEASAAVDRAESPAVEQPAEAQPVEEKPARTRRRATRKATAPEGAPAEVAPEGAAVAQQEPVAEPAAEEKPARTRRRATRKATAPVTAPESAAVAEPVEEPAAESPAVEQPAEEKPAEEKPTRSRRRTARSRAGAPEPQPEPAPVSEPEPAAAPGPEPAAETSGGAPAPDAPRAGRRATRKATATAPAAPSAVFQAPVFQAPMFQTPQRAAEEAAFDTDEDEDEVLEAGATPEPSAAEPQAAPVDDADEDDEEQAERPGRRRRRGGRRRRRSETVEQAAEAAAGGNGASRQEEPAGSGSGQQSAESGADEEESTGTTGTDTADGGDDRAEDNGDEGAGGGSRRRRRRRRRTGDDSEPAPVAGDDPERTVVKVREPRGKKKDEFPEASDGVQSIRGSTRLEAKKQRRREGREQGRRRVPIITEAEFLARREAVERVMVVRESGERTQIGVLEDDVLVEHYVNKEEASSYVGNVYLGKVQNVLPSMEAAFVDIGKGRNAVLYAGEVNFEALGLGHGPRRIESALKSGQPVLAQVTKDPIGHKGARLTSQISLPGRYLVYVPEGSMTGISRKLPDTERARLKQILKKILPENAGVIVRTAAEGASEEELTRDVERLHAQWAEIQQNAKKGAAPKLLYGEPDMTVRVVRDIFNEDFTKVIVSGEQAWNTIHDYVSHVAPDLVGRLQKWTSDVDVFAANRIDEQLMKALDRKVWLPSGGSLVIDRTEAMIVVDVNTGRFTGQGGNLEETVTRNNLEAAEEIVRQLRLRDLGGIIVIDFIDMVLESNRDLVLRRLLECLGRDRTKHQVAEVTSLGLVQMTRKRVGQGLLESFSESCVHCNGRGVIVHMDQPHVHTAVGTSSKKAKRKQKQQEELEAQQAAVAAPAEPEAEAPAAVEPRPEPVAEPAATEFVPDADLYSSAAEAEEAARGGRSRRRPGRRSAAAAEAEAAGAEAVGEEKPARSRRRSRKAVAPVGPPKSSEDTGVTVEASTAGPGAPAESAPEQPVAATEPVPAPEPQDAPTGAARPRRRAVRRAGAPAGPPKAAAPEVGVVVVSGEPAPSAPAAEPRPEPAAQAVAEPEAAPAARPRRRAVRRASAPAGSPGGAAEAAEAAVTVVPAEPAAVQPAPEPVAEEAPAKKKAAKKSTAKKTAARKSTAKKTAKKSEPKAAEADGAETAEPGAEGKKAARKAPAKKSAPRKSAKKATAAAEQPAPSTVSASAGQDGQD